MTGAPCVTHKRQDSVNWCVQGAGAAEAAGVPRAGQAPPDQADQAQAAAEGREVRRPRHPRHGHPASLRARGAGRHLRSLQEQRVRQQEVGQCVCSAPLTSLSAAWTWCSA